MKKSFIKSLFKISDNIFLGKKDKILEYKSKWPIYQLDLIDKNSLWKKFRFFLKKMEEEKKLKTIEINEIDDFYHLNSDIDFEIRFFSSLMKKNYVFKIKNTYYSYTIGYKSKNKIYARFYFDLEKLLKDEAGG